MTFHFAGLVRLFAAVLVCIPFTINVLYAQEIAVDHDGESVFTQPATKQFRFEISADEPASLSYLLWPREIQFRRMDTNEKTVKKMFGILVKGSLTNSGELFTISELNKLHTGAEFEIGYSVALDTFNLEKIPGAIPGAKAHGINFFFRTDNVLLYDSITSIQNRTRPKSFGVKGHYNLFFKYTVNNQKVRWILAMNGEVSRTWNKDDLKNFQDNSSVSFLPSIVVSEEFKGKYGVIKNGMKSRVSVAAPFYFWYLNPVPYIAWQKKENLPYQLNTGLFINVLSKPIEKINFKVPSTIGLGVDWTYTESKFSSTHIFLKGSITIGGDE
jgi:hypothetical protein